ncbi:acyl dehydrogenase NM domain protein [Fusarium subglutinans]|uniref:Acyl dehydrogenase NM domain protein n=1 Tax=Gibberella subglutinans TaxID=42677 RepID=A0A8H5NTF5_GIBSU|nr:acyl dehydrogenase NM domain protein [Fusarium subglutinans]KAF5578571.1 acyl dehydrogenase NM domain protein [Fusarium subglutinans]
MATIHEMPPPAPIVPLREQVELGLATAERHQPRTLEIQKPELAEVTSSTAPLTSFPIFEPRQTTSRKEAFELSYIRAKALNVHYGLTTDDIVNLSPKFFDMHRDDIIIRDIGAHALLSIQHNLVAGTLAPFAKASTKIQGLLDDVLAFKVSAGFMLTEIGHGLDAKNLETEVRLQSDGSFVLHTPRLEASKFVPPSMPVAGVPRIAVVMAKLVVHGEDFGLRPVVVALSDGKQMCKGVTSRLLPYMSGIQAPYAITSFNNVALSSTAVLGSLERPTSMRDNFFHQIARIAPGTLAMSMIMIPALKLVTYITGKYSLRRTVGVANKTRIPIICFRTQQMPILHALAQLAVMTPFANKCIEWFKDTSFKPQVRQGFAVILKAVFIQMAQRSIPEMVERCGAQGLFQHNQICDADNMIRACAISEGDALVVSIRLAVELCLGKYEMPSATKTDCLLAKYEAGLAQEAWDIVSSIPAEHHSQEFNRLFIPRCKPLVLGIGHRMVYETALDAGVDSDLLALYEAGALKENLDWYTEKGLLTRQTFREMENRALDSVEPRLDELLNELNMEPYVTAPIIKEGLFDDFVQGLPTFDGTTEYSVL